MTLPHSQPDSAPIRCFDCGKFVSYDNMESGAARFYFVPDNHFGPERSEWTCAKCVIAEQKR